MNFEKFETQLSVNICVVTSVCESRERDFLEMKLTILEEREFEKKNIIKSHSSVRDKEESQRTAVDFNVKFCSLENILSRLKRTHYDVDDRESLDFCDLKGDMNIECDAPSRQHKLKSCRT